MAPLPLVDVDKEEDEKTFQAAFATVNALVESLRTYRAGRCLAAKGDDNLVVGGFARYDGGQEKTELFQHKLLIVIELCIKLMQMANTPATARATSPLRRESFPSA